MGKRQVRVYRKDIPDHSEELLQSETVQVVLRTRVVLHGVLLKMTANRLLLQDIRAGKHVVSLPDVEEIIYDREAAF
jgi:hypothetical protein